MKKTLLAAASAMVLAVSAVSTSYAKDGFYLGLRGGTTNFNLNNKRDDSNRTAREDYDNTWNISGALGYKYKYFRLEAEYIYRKDVDDDYSYTITGADTLQTHHVKLTSDSFMANAYIDLMPNYWISPFISGGIGMSRLETENGGSDAGTSFKDDDNTFSWMLGAGLSIRLNRCLNLDAGYRYIDMGDLGDAEFNVHEVYGGLRFTF